MQYCVNQFSYLSNREKCISLFTGARRVTPPPPPPPFIARHALQQAAPFWIRLLAIGIVIGAGLKAP